MNKITFEKNKKIKQAKIPWLLVLLSLPPSFFLPFILSVFFSDCHYSSAQRATVQVDWLSNKRADGTKSKK